jgi:hypothetical protein
MPQVRALLQPLIIGVQQDIENVIKSTVEASHPACIFSEGFVDEQATANMRDFIKKGRRR